jgi:hypothetical protein
MLRYIRSSRLTNQTRERPEGLIRKTEEEEEEEEEEEA